jgi:hypothetical protein
MRSVPIPRPDNTPANARYRRQSGATECRRTLFGSPRVRASLRRMAARARRRTSPNGLQQSTCRGAERPVSALAVASTAAVEHPATRHRAGDAVERLVNPQSRWSFEREASTVLSGLAWAWQSMRWRLLLAHAWCGWRTAALSATRRSAVDRRTATMLYACRDRSYSMRRWWPQNSGVHDGHCWTVGDNAGEDRFCCGGAPARRGGFGHRRADLAVTEI